MRGPSEALCGRVADRVRQGVLPVVAARVEGVSERSFSAWMSGSEAFCGAVECAEAELEAALVGSIARAAVDSWPAAAWVLERRFGERWARRSVSAKPAERFVDPFEELDEAPVRLVKGGK